LEKIKRFLYTVKSAILIFLKNMVELILIKTLRVMPGCRTEIVGNDISHILIPFMHGLGDAIIFAPVLKDISRHYRNTKITLLTNSRTHKVMLEFFPEFNYIKYTGPRNLQKLKGQFNLVLNMARSLENYVIALMLRPDYLIGFNYSLLIVPGENHFSRAQRLLPQLRIESRAGQKYNFFSEQAGRHQKFTIERLGVNNKKKDVIVGLITGGRWHSKIYPSDKSRILIEQLTKYSDVRVLLLGTDRGIGNILSENANRVHNLCGTTSIKQVMDCIGQLDLLVGPDGGLLHMAVAWDIPFIGLFSSVDPKTVIPEQYLERIIFKELCQYQPCYNEEHEPFCPCAAPGCIAIEPAEIIQKIEDIYPSLLR